LGSGQCRGVAVLTMTPRKLTLQEQIDALVETNEALRLRLEAGEAMRLDTHKMVSEIHDAWMKPHPVYGDKSLLDVISKVAARASAGEIIGERIVLYAKIAGAVAALSVGEISAAQLRLAFRTVPVHPARAKDRQANPASISSRRVCVLSLVDGISVLSFLEFKVVLSRYNARCDVCRILA